MKRHVHAAILVLLPAVSGIAQNDNTEQKVAQVAEKSPKQVLLKVEADSSIELIYIQSGSFQMGHHRTGAVIGSFFSFETDLGIDEGPPRTVVITQGFYIGPPRATRRSLGNLVRDSGVYGLRVVVEPWQGKAE